MERNKRWLCLDCGKNTFEGNENYYFLKHRLWRQLVPREQRHGMICRACIQLRLGRPLVPEDFGNDTNDESSSEDQPMGEDDYGIYDLLSSNVRQAIDAAIIEFAALRPRKVASIAAYMSEQAPGPIPALHDWFYMDRIVELISDGQLKVVTQGNDYRFDIVVVADLKPCKTI